MCLAVPARITDIQGNRAVVDMAGVVRELQRMLALWTGTCPWCRQSLRSRIDSS